MRIVRGDPSNQATTQACFEIVRAADAVDDPDGPPWSLTRLRGWIEYPTDSIEIWMAVDETTGAHHGWCFLRLPERENRDRVNLSVDVLPSSRRRGIGTALLRHAAERAAAAGRSVLASEAFQGSAGAAFAARVGATAGLVEARRVLALDQIPAGRITHLREQAARAAAGYSLVSWDGRTPDEYLARCAEVENAMADAPHDAGEENEVWDADRFREQIDDLREKRGRHVYTLAALHDASGEMAAVTAVEADQDNPGWGHQQLTAVIRTHRGHRLGLLVKTAMLDWLATAEPQLERIVTGNAAVNQHMIAINDQLGYELLEPPTQSYEIAVADLQDRFSDAV
jgi:GNAT superfamily N-acetyltransferase/RimJ/RimL family protein N-acetyltransferase